MSAATAFVGEIARRLIGGGIDASDVREVVDQVRAEIADEAKEFEARIEAKLRSAFEGIGLLIAADAMVDGARGVRDAFTPKGEIKPLGLHIEQVGPDEQLVDTVVAEVPDPGATTGTGGGLVEFPDGSGDR